MKNNIFIILFIIFGCNNRSNNNCIELIENKAISYYNLYQPLDTIFIRMPINDTFGVKTTVLKGCNDIDWFLYKNDKDLIIKAVLFDKKKHNKYVSFSLRIIEQDKLDVLVLTEKLSVNDTLYLPLNYLLDITPTLPILLDK